MRMLRKWWRWILALLGLGLVTFLGVTWLLFQRVPSWYQPLEVGPGWVDSVRNDFVAAQADLNERLSLLNSPFDYKISQEQLNAWIAAREDIWPLSRQWLPPELSRPFVRLDEGEVRIAATYDTGSVQTVLSARLAAAADEESIRLKLLEVHSGSLPVPTQWLQKQVSELAKRAANGTSMELPDGRRIELDDLFKGVSLPNEGVWWQEQPYRVIGLRLKPGVMTLTFRPLPRRERPRHHLFGSTD